MIKPTIATNFVRKLPTPLYKLAAQTWIDYEFPRHIFIETTANCNLSCLFCPREKIDENMDWNLFKSIIDECRHYGPRSFSLHLFGEPLLYPKILDAIRYIKSSNKRNTILLTTNGTVLNKFASDLLKLRVDRIIWSWRKNNFNDGTRAVLKRIGLIRFLIEETPKGEIERWEGYRKEVKHLHNYGGNINVQALGNDSLLPARYPCYHLFLAPAIRWNGEIVECCNIPKAGSDVLGKYGKVTLAQVWEGKDLQELRDYHLKKVYPGTCYGCNSWQAYPDMFFGFQKKCGHSK